MTLLTQAEIAILVGVTPSRVQGWLSDGHLPFVESAHGPGRRREGFQTIRMVVLKDLEDFMARNRIVPGHVPFGKGALARKRRTTRPKSPA